MLKKITRAIRVRLSHYSLLLNARRISYRNILGKQIRNILVVCYGNIYRSPFVEHYLQKHSQHIDKLKITSAGFYNKSGRKSPDKHIEMVKSYHVDLTMHKSKIISADVLKEADIILIMDRYNWDSLLAIDDSIRTKTVWLGAFSSSFNPEIADPYGKNENEAGKILEKLALSCDKFLNQIVIK